VAHVEFSLSEAFVPQARTPLEPESDSFTRWAATVSDAEEPCLLVDRDKNIAAVSQSCCLLLGLGAQSEAIGQPLLGGGLRLLDFTAARNELAEQEIDKIPPLLALSSGRLARGLLRVRAKTPGESDATVDAIATPLLADREVAGSLTFFSEI
jgi:hypothetical protein